MRAFEYASPTTTEQAVKLLGSSWGETEILAGGTDLLALMKDDVVTPTRLVNIKDIKTLGGVGAGSGVGLRLGALVTIQELLDHPEVRAQYRAIAQAADGIASQQIRNMGTVGGDLCQRPRCWYYRSGYGLLGLDANGKSLVVGGENRYHAILGNGGPAYFVNPSSLAPALIALGAKVRIYGPKSPREVPVEAFYVTPKTNQDREYDLKPNEVVGEILLPVSKGIKSATYEVRQKIGLDWPLATASVAIKMNGNRVQTARIVMGHVAPTPWPSPAAEHALEGKAVTEETAQAAANAAVEKATALSGNAYKIQLARVAVKRAILRAAEEGAK